MCFPIVLSLEILTFYNQNWYGREFFIFYSTPHICALLFEKKKSEK